MLGFAAETNGVEIAMAARRRNRMVMKLGKGEIQVSSSFLVAHWSALAEGEASWESQGLLWEARGSGRK